MGRLLTAFLTILRPHSAARLDIYGAVFTSGLIGVLTILTGILQARLLGPVGRGTLVAIQAWPSVFASFAMLGLQDAIVYYAARDRARAGRYAIAGTAIILAFAMPVAAACWVVLPFLMPTVSQETIFLSRIYLGIIFVFAVNGVAVFLLRAVNAARSWNLARLGPYIIWLLILLHATARHDSAPGHLALTFLAVYACYALVLVWSVRHRLAGFWHPQFHLAARMLRYGLPVAAASLPQLLNQRVDQLLVVSFLRAESLGYYAVATSWASAANLASSAISSVAFPRISGANPSHRYVLLKKVILATAATTGIIALILAATANSLIPRIFGTRFGPSVFVSYLLLIASTLRSLNDANTAGLKGMGSPGGVMASELTGLCVSLPLLAILVPRLGLTGAGLAAIAGSAVTCAVSGAVLRKRLNAPPILDSSHSEGDMDGVA